MLAMMLLIFAIVLGGLAFGSYKLQKIGRKMEYKQAKKIIEEINKEGK